MTDSIKRLLLENVQPRPGRGGWHGGPTTLGALRGVSAAQAAWVPAAGRKNIWELTLHIAYWEDTVRRRLAGGKGTPFPRSPANWPEPPHRKTARAWLADIDVLKAAHEQLLDVIATVPLGRYGKVLPGGKRWTVGELIVGIAQHNAYHTGQIQLVKRLWSATRRSE